MSLNNNSDIIFEGEASIFKKVDLDSWGNTYNLVPLDSDIKSLGFTFVGDMLCLAVGQSVSRCYVHEKEHTSITLLVGFKNSEMNVIGIFIDSEFVNGLSLMTTSTLALKDKTTEKYIRQVCEWKGTYDLYQQHKACLYELSKTNGDLKPMEASLLFLAKAVDSATVNQSKLS